MSRKMQQAATAVATAVATAAFTLLNLRAQITR